MTTIDFPVTKVAMRLGDHSTLELRVHHSERELIRRVLQDLGTLVIEDIVEAWRRGTSLRSGAMPGKAFRIKRQNSQGETLHVPNTNACQGCYRPMPETKAAYCSGRCAEAHRRLTGGHVFACAIDETAA